MKLTYKAIEILYPKLQMHILTDIRNANIKCNKCNNGFYILNQEKKLICSKCNNELNIDLEQFYNWTRNKSLKKYIDEMENGIINIVEIIDKIIFDYNHSEKPFMIDIKKYNIPNDEILTAVLHELKKRGYETNQ